MNSFRVEIYDSISKYAFKIIAKFKYIVELKRLVHFQLITKEAVSE